MSEFEAAWPRWRPEIARACDGSHQTIETIERDLAQGLSHLLTMPDCCFIVELVDYVDVRACQTQWAAGTLGAILDAVPRLQAWAKSQGCSEILVQGHPGWERALKHLGYRRWSVTVRKAL